MKKIILAILIAFAAIACNKMENPVINEEFTEVKFNTVGDFTTSPITKASGGNDLYSLIVMSIDDEGWEHNYAVGIFDDLSNVRVKLGTKNKYNFILNYLPNGKNIVNYSEGYYGVPFGPCYDAEYISLNELRYGSSTLVNGSTQINGVNDYRSIKNDWNSACRYKGYVGEFDPSKSQVVEVELFKQEVEFNITITDFTEGTIYLGDGNNYGHSYSISSSGNSAVLNQSIELQSGEKPSDGQWRGYMNVAISYKESSNSEVVVLYNKTIDAIRNTRYSLEFSLADALGSSGISPTVVQDNNKGEESL